MCILLHLLICTALRAHIIVVQALYNFFLSFSFLYALKNHSDGDSVALRLYSYTPPPPSTPPPPGVSVPASTAQFWRRLGVESLMDELKASCWGTAAERTMSNSDSRNGLESVFLRGVQASLGERPSFQCHISKYV